MAFSIRALAGLARCDRPTSADLSTSVVQPGRYAHGPDEKLGYAGFTAGAVGISAKATLPGRKPCVRARCPEAGRYSSSHIVVNGEHLEFAQVWHTKAQPVAVPMRHSLLLATSLSLGAFAMAALAQDDQNSHALPIASVTCGQIAQVPAAYQAALIYYAAGYRDGLDYARAALPTPPATSSSLPAERSERGACERKRTAESRRGTRLWRPGDRWPDAAD